MSITRDTATQSNAQEAAVPGGSAPERVEIALTQKWDASLSYDVLREDPDADPPVFIGRKELLGPLVSAIEQPDRRGTYLVSGYRGAGKTSLVIEAARRARLKLEKEGWRLLPLVLNVSEVSASLSDASEADAPPLQIDARRLLTALLRSLRNRLPEIQQAAANGRAGDAVAVKIEEMYRAAVRNRLAARWRALRGAEDGRVVAHDPASELLRRVDAAYRKAGAAQYLERSRQGTESQLREVAESRLGIDVQNVLKLAAAGAGILAVGVEGAVLFGPAAAALHALAVALAGAAIVTFRRSRTVSKEATRRESAEVELVIDNSIHQLENDLKDIFTNLQEQKLRTIVVLEELDKVDDAQGKQLDAVIRYFKNLFTQAPALFFFLTDKQYHDLVAKKIDDARRRRTYSVEHTFFTHRVFVNRPTVRECLDYLKTVAVDETEKQAIEEIIEADSYRVRDLNSMNLRERFVRVLLFRAQDHIFDLKNEMRRYMHVDDGRSRLECDADSLASNEQALAVFQFLIEQKARAHSFHGGGEYANEVLRNCLFSVFGDAEPGQSKPPREFYPMQGASGDQVSANEERRIRIAVDSLILDLQRGGVVESDPKTGAIKWIESAARFTPKADVEDHEKELADKLTAHAATLAVLAEGGALHGVVPSAGVADDLVRRLREKAAEPESSRTPLTVEQTMATASSFEGDVATALTAAFDAHRLRLVERLGLSLLPIEAGMTGSAWRLAGVAGESPPDDGVVFLVYGSADLIRQAVTSFAASATRTRRFAIVNVVAAAPTSPWDAQREAVIQEWRAFLGPAVAANALCSVVPLHEELSPQGAEPRWTEATADELVVAALWINDPWRGFGDEPREPPPPEGTYVVGNASGETTLTSFQSAFEHWLRGSDAALCWIAPPGLGVLAHVFGRPLEVRGRPVACVSASASVRADHAAETPDDKVRLDTRQRLIDEGRIILALDPRILEDLSHDVSESRLLPPRARVVIAWPAPPDDPRLSWVVSPESVSTLRNADEEPIELARLVRRWDTEQARALLQPAVERDSPAAMRELVTLYLDQGDRDQAQPWWERLVATDDLEEIELLADAVRAREPTIARALDEAAAERGSAAAMGRLAMDLGEREPDAARTWRDRLVEAGDRWEIEWLADATRERDPDGAQKLYEAAAERGSATAMGRLILGLVERQPEQARDWTDRLLLTGDVLEITRVGAAVLEKHPEEAREWVELAGMADKSPEAVAAVVDVVRAVDPALADSLQPKAAS